MPKMHWQNGGLNSKEKDVFAFFSQEKISVP